MEAIEDEIAALDAEIRSLEAGQPSSATALPGRPWTAGCILVVYGVVFLALGASIPPSPPCTALCFFQGLNEALQRAAYVGAALWGAAGIACLVVRKAWTWTLAAVLHGFVLLIVVDGALQAPVFLILAIPSAVALATLWRRWPSRAP